VIAARAAGLPVLKRADFLGSLMEGKTALPSPERTAKTTTTSMIAWILTALGQNPSFISGGVLANLGVNARPGKETPSSLKPMNTDRMFLGLRPAIEVVTSVEHDHPDCYPSPADYRAAFLEFVERLPADGTLVACAEDAGARALIRRGRKTREDPSHLRFAAGDRGRARNRYICQRADLQ